MKIAFTALLAGLLLTGLHSHAAAATPISATRAKILLPAVAKVTLQRNSTTGLLDYCASRFVSLKPRSENARKRWLQRNKAILSKARILRNRLWQSLKQQQSGLKAETTLLNIDQLIQQNVRKKIHALAAYTPVQQRLICQQLILAVHNGDWDISHKLSKTYSILQNFH